VTATAQASAAQGAACARSLSRRRDAGPPVRPSSERCARRLDCLCATTGDGIGDRALKLQHGARVSTYAEWIGPRAVLSTLAHALGLLAGAVLTGGLLAWIGGMTVGWVDRTALGVVVAIIVAAYALADLWSLPLRMPTAGRNWQVPRRWIGEITGPLTYFLFGGLLGVGFLTIAPYAALTALLVREFTIGLPPVGMLLGLAFGSGKVIAVLIGELQATSVRDSHALVQGIANRMAVWQKTLAASGFLAAALSAWSALAT
jgi:hypothetical protein